ncbi:bifunctional phosphopantothenoylcysteine decarboxylase/phosphopantothenate--cysteine ligase CoaBC [Melioribacteraceae bacterium 4301-Me]|uniref:bifunctional phosphopantothenoylcysteine decarboxylase/phosphopantothenate--cysteine ligase CoaBC n=1 Tax=Pyranulibacter aquaticus TaxID=3163344 RepID=UPI00359545EC
MAPSTLKGKKIIVGVTGCIAAYKSALLVRLLISQGAEVRVVMTPSACHFITPLTLSTLSNNPVVVNMFPETEGKNLDMQTWHIEYATWADLAIIAPATVNTIAKITHGFADNALTSVVLALRSPLIVVPAADVDMYTNPVTQENIEQLKNRGIYVIEPETGFLASGLNGIGRMADVNKIVDAAELVLAGFKRDLIGKKILVTAGPTYEDIDPVRFIGNRSSGKMGYSIAKAAYLRGAKVTLISGPTSENCYPEIDIVKIRSAAQMKNEVEKHLIDNDALIMAAAVADYKPAKYSKSKIKKEQNLKSISLSATDDILAAINSKNSPLSGKKKVIVGFALESEDELKNAEKKLMAKNLDFIVLNSLKEPGAAMESDTNKITILYASEKKTVRRKGFPLLSKFITANNILNELKNYL